MFTRPNNFRRFARSVNKTSKPRKERAPRKPRGPNHNDPRRIVLSHDERRRKNDEQLQANALKQVQSQSKEADHWGNALTVIRRMGLPEPQGEFMFSPDGDWRFDLSWPEFLIALELHGNAFGKGRHTTGAGFTEDRRKMNNAQVLMWRVFEFSGEMLNFNKSTYFVDLLTRVFNRD